MTMLQENPWESTNIMVVLGVRASLACVTFSLLHDAIDMYNTSNNNNNNESINTNSNNSNGNKYTLVHIYDIIYIYIYIYHRHVHHLY